MPGDNITSRAPKPTVAKLGLSCARALIPVPISCPSPASQEQQVSVFLTFARKWELWGWYLHFKAGTNAILRGQNRGAV